MGLNSSNFIQRHTASYFYIFHQKCTSPPPCDTTHNRSIPRTKQCNVFCVIICPPLIYSLHLKYMASDNFAHKISKPQTYTMILSRYFNTHYANKHTIHQVTTMLATFKHVIFPDHNHLLTTSADDPTL